MLTYLVEQRLQLWRRVAKYRYLRLLSIAGIAVTVLIANLVYGVESVVFMFSILWLIPILLLMAESRAFEQGFVNAQRTILRLAPNSDSVKNGLDIIKLHNPVQGGYKCTCGAFTDTMDNHQAHVVHTLLAATYMTGYMQAGEA